MDPVEPGGSVYVAWGPVVGTGPLRSGRNVVIDGTGGDYLGVGVALGDGDGDGLPDVAASATGAQAVFPFSGAGF